MMSPFTLCFIMLLVTYSTMVSCSGSERNATSRGCIARERNALLKLKVSFSDPSNRLSSWDSNTDCCKWQGVECDKHTRHIITLDLHNNNHYYDYASFSMNVLSSEKLDSSILEMKHLSYVDLSGNDFQESSIPSFLGLLNELHHLNLSHANFSGVVPHHLSNLSQLNVLDLNCYHYLNNYPLIVNDFFWASRLSLLRHLDMSGINLNTTKNLFEVLNMFPSIIVLRLSGSRLENKNLGSSFVNASHSNIQRLDLSRNLLDGELPRFLENLTSLRDLDFSGNKYNSCNQANLDRLTNLVWLNLNDNSLDCNVESISRVLENNCHMKSLDLSINSFSGDISKLFLFNLSRRTDRKLSYLDLSTNHFYGQLPEQIDSLKMLKLLDLGGNNLSGHIPSSIGNLTALEHLDLVYNNLSDHIPSSIGNLTTLVYLHLQFNHLSGLIPSAIGNMRALEYMDLSTNQLTGLIPSSIGNMRALEYLDLSTNQLTGLIPSTIGNLSDLTRLSLNGNQLNGDIPLSLGKLSKLIDLDIFSNHLEGTITETHLSMLKELRFLRVGGNNFIKFIVGSDWVPPFQLFELYMHDINIGGDFPRWLRTQKELDSLTMSNCSISGHIPFWFRYINIMALYLPDNQIEGPLPDLLCEMKSVDLSGNRFSGNLPDCLLSSLIDLKLSNNNITGHLPDAFAHSSSLTVLILSSNQLSGLIPNSIGGAYSLEWLQLSNNNFTGEIPSSIRNCTALWFLDIGHNSISGKLPQWIENHLLNLKILNLRSNELYGTIPRELCQLAWLQMLDLADNKLVGNIPHCFGNFSGMVIYNSTETEESYTVFGSLQEVIKGVAQEYFRGVRYLVNMDLSNNKLVGEIPLELTGLDALHFLNLSYNHLHGKIPGRIGDMRLLEALDLSNNVLSGNIPTSLENLVSHLNLSHNNLTGAIPIGRQLQTLEDPSIYEGNSSLCGPPLVKRCHDDKAPNPPNAETHVADGDEDKVEKIWLYGIITSGFATGFWGVIGVLVLKQSWRHVYFRFADEVMARI